ncbi:unnamed protein product [Microthlaspi erraticum]|uniref:RNase H type-1 domain-containing protein n=1 Tax=Microthlaspi erraticum TaxID=1685480 RepID=A0A6D2JG66_9BRAS|nr:unnamed protein product [Microthlaspi erraticum]
MGVGWIIRDAGGQYMESGWSRLPQVSSSLQAEAMGFLYVTQRIWSRGLRNVWFENDSLELVNVINRNFSLARRTKLRKFGRARRSSRRPKVTILIWKDRYLSHASRRSGMKPFGSTMRPRLIFYRDMSGKRVNEAHGGFGVSNGPSSSAKGLDRIEKRPG